MKPTYPELLKAFKLSVKENPTEEESKYISETIEKLKQSEDWGATKQELSNALFLSLKSPR